MTVGRAAPAPGIPEPGAKESLLSMLREREKELTCLYKVDEVLGDQRRPLPEIFTALVDIIPSGWRFPELCRARIVFQNSLFQPDDFIATPLSLSCPIDSDGQTAGSIEVVYLESVPETAEGVFLDKERQLIRTIADRIGQYLFCRDVKLVLDELNSSRRDSAGAAMYGECDYRRTDGHEWRWRQHMAERLAASLDARLFGVKSVYLIGSTNDGTAGRRSDIDLIIHFEGSESQKVELFHWLEGWSLCLDEVNYLKTGYRMNGLLDVHIVTNDDIARKTCFAVKIGLATEPAYRLKTKDETGLG